MGGLVQLATPCRIAHNAAAPARLVTEARVQHKAVKLMTKRRPKKHSLSDRKHVGCTSYDPAPTPPPQFTLTDAAKSPAPATAIK